MLAAAGTVESLTDADDWRFEGKWDGIRALAEIGGGRFRLTSRTGRDITHVYPELAGMPDLVRGHSVVLDGEIVALDAKGRSDFGLMQQRMNLSKAAEIRRAAGEVPVEFWCFDLLHLDGVSLLRKSYDDRRRLLEALAPASEYVSVPEQLPGTAAEALARSRELRWEGIVAKRGGSSYRSGQRAQSWIKLKNQSTQEGVVVGWRRGAGRREGGVGSLLMGVYTDSGDLVYIGRVGTGFTDAALDRLHDQLKPLQRKTSPLTDGIPRLDAKDAVWVRPELVGEVTFVEWTKDGRLRAPSWRGLRPDKRPTDVRREG